MNKSFFSVQLKIAAGLLLIAFIFLVNAIATYTFSQQILNSITKDYITKDRAMLQLTELRTLVIKSQLYTGDWIYREKDIGSKLTLRKIHSDDFTSLQIELKQISDNLEKSGQIDKSQLLEGIMRRVDTLFTNQKVVMQTLNADTDYEDPIKRFESETLFNSKIVPLANDLTQRLDRLIVQEKVARNEVRSNFMGYLQSEKSLELVAAIFVVVVAISIWQYSSRQIIKPIREIKSALSTLSIGEIPPPVTTISNDEIGEIGKAINQLIGGLSKLSEFATHIGNGDYDISYRKLGDNDVLGNSLLTMRDNLKQLAIEDARRNWANEGAAKFADLLRANNHSIPNLTKVVLSELIKYVEANQGCFFVIDQQSQEPQMELMATFAWNRQRVRNKTVRWGEGLIGQAWAEKDTLFITEIPQNYIEIGSGLGDANPKNIVAVPLIFNDEVYGVIELASFSVLPTYRVEFLKRVAENIASTLAATFVAERTQRLLQESQSISEQLRVQEEEMRQNLEELLSTQEQSARNMEMAKSSSESLEQIIESLPDAIVQVDADWYILKMNNNLCHMTGYSREALLGTNIVRFAKQLNPATLKSGETYIQEITRKDRSVFMAEMTVHQLNADEFVIYLRDIDEQVKKDKERAQLMKELEQLRQGQR
ncbi:GAF domain-containing protein [Rhodoflexus caldus]|uniref:GAF domain-containing protein n=1 Tax=Rhodoflexus caldus TaxID=2891236 RepID=UPI00202A7E95|nr:GAF domain-containing protein [Rhodoflexus caldus]